MRILIAHNRYQQAGGEDAVVSQEIEMLTSRGHEVQLLSTDNYRIVDSRAQVAAAFRSFYSLPSYELAASKIRSFRPDIFHVHNTVPSLSPAIYYAANKADVPVVQTLHNYRLICANAQLFRDGTPCEECVKRRSFMPGVVHACYRDSRVGAAVVGAGTALHSILGTWQHRIDRYIVLSKFAADKLAGYRVPLNKMCIKPNFTGDRGLGPGDGGYALFVGRLREEKGLDTLLTADLAGILPMPIYIAGDGPMLQKVHAACSRPASQLRCLGSRSREEVIDLMKHASVLLIPSLWHETFGMVAIEAFATGLPVIAARMGALSEIVEEGVSGLLYEAGDAAGMTRALRWLADHPADVARMRVSARNRYLERYSEEENYNQLLSVYNELLLKRVPSSQTMMSSPIIEGRQDGEPT